MQGSQPLASLASSSHGLAVDVDPVADDATTLLQPGDEDGLQGLGANGGQDAIVGVVGRDAVGQFQEGTQEVFMVACPVGDFHEVVAVGQYAAKATEQDIAEEMFTVASHASRIGDGL